MLPGLGATVPRRVTMGAHMHLGAAAMLLGALQFCAPLRRRSPTFHRWSGRIVTSLMVLCSMSGLVFICLKGRLVGGYNMSVAFALGGTWFAICAGMCWWTAHARNFERHWAWAVRCYAACLSRSSIVTGIMQRLCLAMTLSSPTPAVAAKHAKAMACALGTRARSMHCMLGLTGSPLSLLPRYSSCHSDMLGHRSGRRPRSQISMRQPKASHPAKGSKAERLARSHRTSRHLRHLREVDRDSALRRSGW